MASSRNYSELNKLSDDKIAQYSEVISDQAREEYLLQCKIIREAFEKSQLTIDKLSRLARVSPGTVKNVIHAKRHSITQDVFNRLRTALQIQLSDGIGGLPPPIEINKQSGDSPLLSGWHKTIWLDGYDPHAHTDIVRSQIRWNKSEIPYFALHHSRESTENYLSLIRQGSYGEYLKKHSYATEEIAAVIGRYINQSFDIICLTVGHGWNELSIAHKLLSDEHLRLENLWLVSPNIYILNHGVNAIRRQMIFPPERHRSLLLVMGEHEEFLSSLSSFWPRNRVFLLFGTMMNHHDCKLLLSLISQKATLGDIVVFDMCAPYGKSLDRKDIYDSDPRLSGNATPNMIQTVEDILLSSILEIDDKIEHIAWCYQVVPSCNNRLESYSINMLANIYRKDRRQQSISALMIHRHAPSIIATYMKSQKWRPLELKQQVSYHPAMLLAFQKC